MAFLSAEDKEKDDQDQQGGQPGATQEKILSSTAGGQIQANAGQSAAGTAKAPSKSGVFTNLNSYVTANAGNDAAMGSKVKGVVDNTANAATQKTTQLQQTGQSAVQQGTVQRDDSIIEGVKTAPGAVDKNKFQQLYNASYGGPKAASEVDGYAETKAGYDKVGQQTQAATADGMVGRGSLLNDAYGRPQYTRGERNLDSYILGTGAGGQQKLKEIGDTYGNFGQGLTAAESALGQTIKQGQDTTQATRDATRTAYGDTRTAAEKYFEDTQKQLASKNEMNAKTAADAASKINSPNREDRLWAYQQIGMDPAEGEYLHSLKYQFGNYATQGGSQLLGDVADTGKVDHYSQLLGLLDESPAISFAKTGASGNALDVNSVQKNAANELFGINRSAEQKLAEQNTQRKKSFNELLNQIGYFQENRAAPGAGMSGTGFAGSYIPASSREAISKALGLSGYAVDAAAAKGLDLSQYVAKGRDLGLGDVLTDADRSRMGELGGALQVGPQDSWSDAGDEGAAVALDKPRFVNDMKSKLQFAEDAPLMAELEKLLKG